MSIPLIKSVVDRADQLVVELQAECKRCLPLKEISPKALNLTHEVVEKCANALDQVMTLAWQIRVRPKLSTVPGRAGYFPASKDEASFKSALGQWGVADLVAVDPPFEKVLRVLQPFTSEQNMWLKYLRELAAKKHTGLVPQKRFEERRVTVSRQGGSVSWGPGVTFGSGVSVMGVPIDPRTQLPVQNTQVNTTIETWVSFQIEGTGLNALGFCQDAVRKTRAIIEQFDHELLRA